MRRDALLFRQHTRENPPALRDVTARIAGEYQLQNAFEKSKSAAGVRGGAKTGAEVDYEMSTGERLVRTAGVGLGAYHGYLRNHGSLGWAVGWALLGGMFPIVTIPVSLAQGFGKPSKGR